MLEDKIIQYEILEAKRLYKINYHLTNVIEKIENLLQKSDTDKILFEKKISQQLYQDYKIVFRVEALKNYYLDFYIKDQVIDYKELEEFEKLLNIHENLFFKTVVTYNPNNKKLLEILEHKEILSRYFNNTHQEFLRKSLFFKAIKEMDFLKVKKFTSHKEFEHKFYVNSYVFNLLYEIKEIKDEEQVGIINSFLKDCDISFIKEIINFNIKYTMFSQEVINLIQKFILEKELGAKLAIPEKIQKI